MTVACTLSALRRPYVRRPGWRALRASPFRSSRQPTSPRRGRSGVDWSRVWPRLTSAALCLIASATDCFSLSGSAVRLYISIIGASECTWPQCMYISIQASHIYKLTQYYEDSGSMLVHLLVFSFFLVSALQKKTTSMNLLPCTDIFNEERSLERGSTDVSFSLHHFGLNVELFTEATAQGHSKWTGVDNTNVHLLYVCHSSSSF